MQFDGLGAETARYFYHTDHLGSVRLLTDAGGSPVQGYEYSAYGMRVYDPKDDPALYNWAADATLNPFTYTGREYHAPSGLYFYRARWYDPEVGQFLSVDPIGQNGGPNVYAYVSDNPVNALDPRGLQGSNIEDPNGALVSAAQLYSWAGNGGVLVAAAGVRDELIETVATDLAIACAFSVVPEGAVGRLFGRGGILPVLRGQAGVEESILLLEARGYGVLGREITVQTTAGLTRFDLLIRTPQGRQIFVEVKKGLTARLTSNQTRVIRRFMEEGGIPRGRRAARALLPVNEKIPASPVLVIFRP